MFSKTPENCLLTKLIATENISHFAPNNIIIIAMIGINEVWIHIEVFVCLQFSSCSLELRDRLHALHSHSEYQKHYIDPWLPCMWGYLLFNNRLAFIVISFLFCAAVIFSKVIVSLNHLKFFCKKVRKNVKRKWTSWKMWVFIIQLWEFYRKLQRWKTMTQQYTKLYRYLFHWSECKPIWIFYLAFFLIAMFRNWFVHPRWIKSIWNEPLNKQSKRMAWKRK